MKIKWTDKFLNIALSNGLAFKVLNIEHGWFETLIIGGRRFLVKSKTYKESIGAYYIGVDPKKLKCTGEIVLICGGSQDGQIRDIFLFPWGPFFNALRLSDPVNTYRPPKIFLQYRFYLRDRNDRWIMSVQPAGCSELDVTHWRYSVDQALNILKCKNTFLEYL
jgi:hypothetical protein